MSARFGCVYAGPPWAAEDDPFRSGAFVLVLEDGTSRRLVNAEITVGRSSDCYVCISSPVVSRVHAVLHSRSGQWYLEDKGSMNGTALNSQRLTAGREYALREGDQITLSGRVKLLFKKENEQPAGGGYPRTHAVGFEEPGQEG